VTGHNFGFDREFVGGKFQGFSRQVILHTAYLEHNSARLHYRNPEFDVAFPLPHPRFSGFLSNRLIWEDTDPHFPTPPNATNNRPASGLNLASAHPTWFLGLKTIISKMDFCPTAGTTPHPATHLLPIFNTLWH
jgi:hypothetical protein